MRSDVTLFEYVKDVGAGRLRKRMAAIPDDDPLLAGGWEHIKPELAKLGVLKMQDQATARAKAEQVAAASQRAIAEQVAQERALWERGGTRNPEQLAKVFGRLNPAAQFVISDPTGKALGIVDEAAIKRAVKRGRGIALRPKVGHIVVSVREDTARGFEEKFEIPTTLCWSGADGWRNYIMRGNARGTATGEHARVIVPGVTSRDYFCASVKGAKWHVPPAKALPKGEARLPRMPAALASILRGIGEGGSGALDAALT